jgi:hypothetical protein
MDFTGVGLLSAGLVALILGISEGQYWGRVSVRVIGLFVSSAFLLLGFVYAEIRVSNPFISMKLLRI